MKKLLIKFANWILKKYGTKPNLELGGLFLHKGQTFRVISYDIEYNAMTDYKTMRIFAEKVNL